jgi:hypothetical protein
LALKLFLILRFPPEPPFPPLAAFLFDLRGVLAALQPEQAFAALSQGIRKGLVEADEVVVDWLFIVSASARH